MESDAQWGPALRASARGQVLIIWTLVVVITMLAALFGATAVLGSAGPLERLAVGAISLLLAATALGLVRSRNWVRSLTDRLAIAPPICRNGWATALARWSHRHPARYRLKLDRHAIAWAFPATDAGASVFEGIQLWHFPEAAEEALRSLWKDDPAIASEIEVGGRRFAPVRAQALDPAAGELYLSFAPDAVYWIHGAHREQLEMIAAWLESGPAGAEF